MPPPAAPPHPPVCPAGRPPGTTEPLARPPAHAAPAPPRHSWPAAPATTQAQLEMSVGNFRGTNACKSVGGELLSSQRHQWEAHLEA